MESRSTGASKLVSTRVNGLEFAKEYVAKVLCFVQNCKGDSIGDVDVIRSHRLFTPEALKKIQSDKRPSKLTIQGAKRANAFENKPSTSTSNKKQKNHSVLWL